MEKEEIGITCRQPLFFFSRLVVMCNCIVECVVICSDLSSYTVRNPQLCSVGISFTTSKNYSLNVALLGGMVFENLKKHLRWFV